jgi:hypothetical protein
MSLLLRRTERSRHTPNESELRAKQGVVRVLRMTLGAFVLLRSRLNFSWLEILYPLLPPIRILQLADSSSFVRRFNRGTVD